MRFFALLLVVAVPSAAGFGKTLRLRRRVQALTALTAALEIMRSEIYTRFTPLMELVGTLSADAPEPARGFFRNLDSALPELGELGFAEIWQGAVEAESALSADDKTFLSPLGLQLGRYEAGEQAAAIDHVLARLERNLSEAKEQLNSKGTVFTGLGIASGLLLAVILI